MIIIENNLGAVGLKQTKQRQKIVDILIGKGKPITAEILFCSTKEFFPNIALTTIYRNLDVLLLKGLVRKIMHDDGTARYEYAENPHAHSHFITCTKCNKTMTLKNCPMEKLEVGVEYETGFKVTGHNLQIYGFCEDCINKN